MAERVELRHHQVSKAWVALFRLDACVAPHMLYVLPSVQSIIVSRGADRRRDGIEVSAGAVRLESYVRSCRIVYLLRAGGL